jgi:hypothetical protein
MRLLPVRVQTNPLRDKHANLMGMAGNESRLQELQKLRNEKLMQMPGPGSYHVEVSPLCLPTPLSLSIPRTVEGEGVSDGQAALVFASFCALSPYDKGS